MKQACMTRGADIWTLTYTQHPDDSVTILNFDKDDTSGHMFHETLPNLDSIQEGAGQIAESVTIDGKTFVVRNQQNVFTYKQPL